MITLITLWGNFPSYYSTHASCCHSSYSKLESRIKWRLHMTVCVCVWWDWWCCWAHTASLFWFCPPPAPVTWRSGRTPRDEGEEVHPAPPGHTQGQLYLWLHCIKPIIRHQGLFSATVNVLFTRLKSVANGGVIYGAGGRDCKHVFLSPSYKRINKKTAVRRFNSEKPLSLGLCAALEAVAKKAFN